MNETNLGAETEPRAVPASRRRRWAWRPKVRWFFSELAVVVAGILIALALQSWWAERNDRAAELALLREMIADLEQDSTALVGAARKDNQARAMTAEIVQWLDEADAEPDTVAMRRLSDVTTIYVRGAAYEALKSRGLGLVRDDSLRSAITSFYEQVGLSVENHNGWIRIAETRWMPLLLRRFRFGDASARPRDAAALRADEEFRLFLDEYSHYMRFTEPWKLSVAAKTGELLASLRREVRSLE